ncbi:MBL fold metallo-hydrolase [Ilyomonas limi]|uniref:MBL fold metallo-hydrolase n=1 Tax=Ilyomonas limi TaxID=2575867 RepID=A0A4U3L8T7_9BACT|nr:MBL fold metallo-hydrolase [Ilyomonas limi]TKK70929.1 MBL fold metallo-hydrolase [Ilyomonas limi]
MRIAFHGAARTVTGSKHLITLQNDTQLLLDCGMFQGLSDELTDSLNSSFGFEADKVSYLLLSHAHIDHSGLIPKLVKEGFKGKIICTAATRDLAMLLLQDSADIQRSENQQHRTQRGKQDEVLEPLYTMEDVSKTAELFEVICFEEWVQLQEGVEVYYTNTGHIIGSAAITIRVTEEGQTKTLHFSGDVGRYRDVLLCPPQPFPKADFIIIESTYGNSLHENQFSTTDQLMKWIKHTCVEKQGKLIIPAFSVGRTQELLYFLNQLSLEKRLPEIPVIVDSPLSYETTQVVKKYPALFNERLQKVLEIDDDPFSFPGMRFTRHVEESMQLEHFHDPCIIIAASGMADAGRIRHHIKNNVEFERNTILLVGYCSPSSLGGQLIHGDKQVKINGQEYNVHAEIGVMRSMSAHGDADDLARYLSCQEAASVTTVFLVHGEYDVQQDFQKKLMLKGYEQVLIPEMHAVCGLNEIVAETA